MGNQHLPEVFNSNVDLGALLHYHPIRKVNRWGSLLTCLVLETGAVLVFLYGVYTSYLAYQLHGPAMINDTIASPTLIALLLFVLGLLAGWGAFVNWKKGVVLYERGFAYNDRRGLQIWRWDDILTMTSAVTRHYTNGIYTGTSHVYKLLNRQNQKLKLADSISKVEDLAKAVDTNIFPLLYPRAADHYNAGEALAFGPVGISKHGITIGKKMYPWTDVKEVSIHRGILKVSKKEGGWFSGASTAASTIPNLRILLAIIHQVVGIKAG